MNPKMIGIRDIAGGQMDKWTYKTLHLLSYSLAFIMLNRIASRFSVRRPRKTISFLAGIMSLLNTPNKEATALFFYTPDVM